MKPILVFDSGVGGLSVLRELRILAPERRFVYFADDAAFPYGDWEEEALKAHMIALFERMIAAFSPQVILIACNTASTLAIAALREAYPEQAFVGTVPAIKPAAERTRSGMVSVLATPGTVERQYTRDLIRDYAGKCHVRLVGSASLAALAENYMRDGHVDEGAVASEIDACFIERDGKKTDIVVLACTHYPFLVNRMRKVAPWPVDWIDPAEAIARRTISLLGTRPDDWPDGADPAIFTSGRDDFALERVLKGFGLTLDEDAAIDFQRVSP